MQGEEVWSNERGPIIYYVKNRSEMNPRYRQGVSSPMERIIRNFIRFAVVMCLVASLGQPKAGAQHVRLKRHNEVYTHEKQASPLLREPTNPDEYLQSIFFLVGIGRSELARDYLQKLLDQKLDTETLFALRQKHGAAKLLRLTRVKQLEPLASTFYAETGEAVRARARDPRRITRLIGMLSASTEERVWAIAELRKSGTVAVPHLLHAIQDPRDAAERAGAIKALVHLGKEAVPPLIGVLESDDPALKAVALSVLRRIGDPRAAPFLYSLAAKITSNDPEAIWAGEALEALTGQTIDTPQAASTRLRRLAQRYYRAAERLSAGTEQSSVELWSWNQMEKVPVPRELSPQEAAYDLGLRFARQAVMLAPDDAEAQTLLLSLMLQREASLAGFERPLPQGPGTAHDLAIHRGTELVASVLRRALEERQTVVALAATRLLAELNAENHVHATGWRPGLLLQAIDYPDRRVQLAGAKAVLDLRPGRSYAGSNRILSVLERAVGIEDRPKVLVADVHSMRAKQLASLFEQLGYSAELALTGREAFTRAAESAGIDLIAINPMILRYGLSETIANLRADSRTAGIPIVIVGPMRLEASMARLERREPDLKFLVRPLDAEGLRVQLDAFLADKGPKFLLASERAAYREFAYDWLLRIADGELPQFDPLRAEKALQRALSNPHLAPRAAKDLGLTSLLSPPREPRSPTMPRHAQGNHRKALDLVSSPSQGRRTESPR